MKTRLRCPSVPELITAASITGAGGGRVAPSAGLCRWRQQLVAAGIGRLDARRDLPEAEFGELLAVSQTVDVDRREEGHDRFGLAKADHLPKVRHEVQIAEPGEER